MLTQLDAASVVLTAVKKTLMTGPTALHRLLGDKHRASHKKVKKICADIKEDFVGGGNKTLNFVKDSPVI